MEISYHCIILNICISNTRALRLNNPEWTLGDYQRVGSKQFIPDLEKTFSRLRVRGTTKEIEAQADYPKIIEALDSLSQRYPEDADNYIIGVKLPIRPVERSVVYLKWRWGESIPQTMLDEVQKRFHQPNNTSRLGYAGADNHDYGHLITGFEANSVGEARQVIFDMYFQHILRGFTAEEAIGLSLKPSLQLAKLACSRLSLCSNYRILNNPKNLVKRADATWKDWLCLRGFIHKKQKDTSVLLEQVSRTVLNEWTFPNGHDVNQVNQSLAAVERYLKLQEEESLHNNPGIKELSSQLKKGWLNNKEIEDITNYSLYCALKCLSHLSTLEPNIKTKTIQEVMDINHHFNMELFLKSTGFGTTQELKLPTYQEWCSMLSRNPNIKINDLLNPKKVE